MRLRAIRIQAFRGWREPTRLELGEAVTLLVGENRSGKSSTTNAIEWCLYGRAVEKQSPGLEERAQWEVRPRDGGGADTMVTLVFENGVEVTRRRSADAAARGEDVVEVRREGEAPLAGPDALAWLAASDLPSWDEYRRIHCFHQEAARTRITDRTDRSAVLASLLGLEEDLRVREAIEAQTRADLLKGVDGVLDELERSLVARLARPRQDLLGAEEMLAKQGVGRGDLGPDRMLATRRELVEDARGLAARLGIDAVVPDADDAEGVRTWAAGWSRQARAAAPALDRLPALREERGRLASARALAQPAQDAWRAARDRVRQAVDERGDEAARRERLEAAEAARTEADRALRRISALTALLREARALLPEEPGPADCPVCRTPVEGLRGRVDESLAALESAEVEAATEARDAAEAKSRAARREVDVLAGLVRDEQAARNESRAKREELARLLKADPGDEAQDLVAAATARLEDIDREGKALAHLQGERDESLARHAKGADLLRELERWDRLRAAADRVVDVDALASKPALDAAVDAAASFAADLDALAAMARRAQEERSTRREAEVNQALGAYLALITGEPDAVRVHVHRTAKRLTYDLVDAAGRSATPVLNQAGLNALSLAMLFAQAEHRARTRGTRGFVVLDDPVQSLDTVRQEGLARAVARLAEHVDVVCASTPSHFVDRVREAVSAPRLVHTLAPWDGARRAALAGTEAL